MKEADRNRDQVAGATPDKEGPGNSDSSLGKARLRAARLALPALFAALISAAAFMALPLPGSPVPLVLQNLMAVLSGLLLGPLRGAAAVLLFLALGALGFPVFSAGHGGLAWLVGPTGGYLGGYLVAALLAGLLARSRRLSLTILGTVGGFAAILLLGAIRLKFYKGIEWPAALTLGVLPFLVGDGIKAAVAIFLSSRLGSFIDEVSGRGG